jgi:hypothetical protein
MVPSRRRTWRGSRSTTLQRAFVTHLDSGAHWHTRTGILWTAGTGDGALPRTTASKPGRA